MKRKRKPAGSVHVLARLVADHGPRGLVVVATSKRAPCCAYTNECRATRKGGAS